MWRQLLFVGSIVMASEARADVTDYCAAYARDFADHVKKQDVEWQTRYDNSEASCLARFSNDAAPAPMAKPKLQKAISKQPPKVPPAAPVEEQAPAAPIAQSVAKLEPGSAEWTAYCRKKYVSFDASKGTYLSKTGVERKCLVTAESPAPSAKALAPKKPPAKPPAKR